MGRQSTRHRYRNRRDKNREVKRALTILGWGLLVFIVLMLIKNGREWWTYYRTYLG